jgi:hypothetical protein
MREGVNGVLGGPIVKERKTPIPSAKILTDCRIQTEASPTTRTSEINAFPFLGLRLFLLTVWGVRE